jgi:mono/diheme cytochrome c family protein
MFASRYLAAFLMAWPVGVLSTQAAVEATPERSLAETYQLACAACHGEDGRLPPDSPRLQNFARPPADFTDPLFNSREPRGDWFLVVKHGGPALGLSVQMPSYAEAFSDAEIRDLIDYTKSLAGPHRYPPGDLNFFLPIRTVKAFPEDEVVIKTRYTDEAQGHAWRNVFEFEKRVGARSQVSLELVQDIVDEDAALNAMEVGWQTALAYSLPHQSIASFGAKLIVPFDGDAQYEALPFLAVAKGLSDRFTLQASLRSHLPFEVFEEGDAEVSAIVHWLPTEWPRGIFPALEATARVPFEQGDEDAVQLSFTPQFHVGLSKGGHVQLNAGVEVPVTRRTYDYRVHVHLLWDFADGWFWQRW